MRTLTRAVTMSILTAPLLISMSSGEEGRTDDTSKALLEAWANKEYHLGTAGVQTASFELKGSSESSGSGTAANIGTGWKHHSWTRGKDATLWGIVQLVAMFAKPDRSAAANALQALEMAGKQMTLLADTNALREALKGATLTARMRAETPLAKGSKRIPASRGLYVHHSGCEPLAPRGRA